MEFGELIDVVVIDTIATFDRVELLSSGAEVETLSNVMLAICLGIGHRTGR